jgi:hypothetical protein
MLAMVDGQGAGGRDQRARIRIKRKREYREDSREEITILVLAVDEILHIGPAWLFQHFVIEYGAAFGVLVEGGGSRRIGDSVQSLGQREQGRQRAESRKQRAQSTEHRAGSREQRTENRDQRAESREQRSESREQGSGVESRQRERVASKTCCLNSSGVILEPSCL